MQEVVPFDDNKQMSLISDRYSMPYFSKVTSETSANSAFHKSITNGFISEDVEMTSLLNEGNIGSIRRFIVAKKDITDSERKVTKMCHLYYEMTVDDIAPDIKDKKGNVVWDNRNTMKEVLNKFVKEYYRELQDYNSKIKENEFTLQDDTTSSLSLDVNKEYVVDINEYQKLLRENEELKELLNDNSVISDDPHQKPRLDLLYRIAKPVIKEYEKVNKTELAKIMNYITCIPIGTCKNYLVDNNINHSFHHKELAKVRESLSDVMPTVEI